MASGLATVSDKSWSHCYLCVLCFVSVAFLHPFAAPCLPQRPPLNSLSLPTQTPSMAGEGSELQCTTVKELRPNTSGHNLIVKVGVKRGGL